MLIDITSNYIFWKLFDSKRTPASPLSPSACLHPLQGLLDLPKNQENPRIPICSAHGCDALAPRGACFPLGLRGGSARSLGGCAGSRRSSAGSGGCAGSGSLGGQVGAALLALGELGLVELAARGALRHHRIKRRRSKTHNVLLFACTCRTNSVGSAEDHRTEDAGHREGPLLHPLVKRYTASAFRFFARGVPKKPQAMREKQKSYRLNDGCKPRV